MCPAIRMFSLIATRMPLIADLYDHVTGFALHRLCASLVMAYQCRWSCRWSCLVQLSQLHTSGHQQTLLGTN